MATQYVAISRAYVSQSSMQNCAYGVTGTLLLYDQLITFSQGIESIWSRKWTVVTVIYTINQVLGALYAIWLLLLFSPTTRISICLTFQSVSYLPMFLVWAAFSSLRVYAVGRCAWRAAMIVLVMCLVPFATNVYDVATISLAIKNTQWPPLDPPMCTEFSKIGVMVGKRFVIVTRICSIAADFVVILTTWCNTYSIVKNTRHLRTMFPVVRTLLQDGSIYFVLLLLLNIVQIVLMVSHSKIEVDTACFVTALWSIIISRFLLHLRQVSEMRSVYHTQTSLIASQFADIRITSTFIGNMGAPLGNHEMYAAVEDRRQTLGEDNDDGGEMTVRGVQADIEELMIP